jgi:hypothetical protein
LLFTSLVILDLKGLVEVSKHSSPSSLLGVKLISFQRSDSAFLDALLTDCSLFRLLFLFEAIDFFENKGQRVLSGLVFASTEGFRRIKPVFSGLLSASISSKRKTKDFFLGPA